MYFFEFTTEEDERDGRGIPLLTALVAAQKVGEQILRQAILLCHSTLEGNHFDKDALVVSFEVPYPASQVIPFFPEPMNLGLEHWRTWVWIAMERGKVGLESPK